MLTGLSVHELAGRFRRKEATPTQAARAYLDRITALDPKIKAYMTVTADRALAQAAAADARFQSGRPLGLLDGIPLAIKDVLCTRGIRTTCSSRILENFVPPYDATVVAKLLDAGAVILGKLNMDEFAMGSSTENSAFFTTRNPWDLARVPGGSSGGAAAAVAADLAAATLGTDTGGSIRQPAAFCGRVGLKPTYGRVSRYGLVAFASSLDQVGPFGKDVRDAALVLQAKASSNLARYDGVKYGLRVPGARDLIDMYSRTRGAGFGAEVKRRVMLGTYALSAGYYDAYYGKALRVRTLVQRDFQRAFERVDVIVAPTTPGVAFKMGEREDPLQMYLNDVFTIPVNLAGLPGVSIPGGFTQTGLPVGLQIIGKAFDEATVLRVARAYEAATAWHERKPELTA